MLRDPIAASSLFPGAMVDVLATVDKSGPGNAKESVTRTVIERAKVLALADDGSAPAYVSALGETDTENGWREGKASGGCLITVSDRSPDGVLAAIARHRVSVPATLLS